MSASWHGGKGSTPRPRKVDNSTFENNWDKIFKKNKKQKTDDKKK